MRAELILGLLLLAGCCTRPERERSIALERPILLPTRTHRIALAELRRVTHPIEHRDAAHNQAPKP
jgi:hypothetical protein